MDENNNGLKEYFNSIRKSLTLEKTVVRIVISWLYVTCFFYIKTDGKFTNAQYAADINYPMMICFMVIIFAALTCLSRYKIMEKVEIYAPMILITLYGYETAYYNKNVSYILGLAVFLAISIFYAVNKTIKFYEIRNKISVIVIYALCAALFLLFVGRIAVLRYVTYRSPGYDFGIWSQMFYYMKKCFQPLTTCERSEIGLMSHFKVHFSPVYYLFLPFYMIFPYPVTLNVLQVITIVSGIIPVYKICRVRKLSNSATAVFALIFMLYPAFCCGTFYDLHENCFLVPFLLWLFYFIEKDNIRGIIIFSLLTMLIKEDAPVYTACIGLYLLFIPKKHKKGGIVFIISIVYFALVTALMKKFGLGIMDNRFTNYMVNSAEGGLIDVIKNFFSNPVYVISECFSAKKLEFMFYMLFPTGMLVFATKKVSTILLFIPILLENLVSNYQYQYSIFFQYVFGSGAILLYLSIINYSQLGEKTRRFMASFAVCMGIMLIPICGNSRKYYVEVYKTEQNHISELNEVMDSIPKDAKVCASPFFVAHLSDRDYLYEYPVLKDAEYIVLDLRFDDYEEDTIELIKKKGYEVIKEKSNLYMVLKIKEL